LLGVDFSFVDGGLELGLHVEREKLAFDAAWGD